MIKITVITLGKLKEKYLRDACGEYEKRLSRYADFGEEELSPVSLPDNPSRAEIDAALEKEAEKITKHIPRGAFTVALCVEGNMMTSERFSALVGEKCQSGTPMCFIIGSSYGLAEKIKKSADMCLSVSEMTFPHQLFRVMMYEQIYRAFKINEGGTYHK